MKKIIFCSLLSLSSFAHGANLFDQLTTPNRNNYTGTVGVNFTVGAANLSVTHLGFQDANLDGLASSHLVGIWDNSGTLIASATIQSGTASTLVDNWRYESLAGPVTLFAGLDYTIGGFVSNAGDVWSDNGGSASVTSSSDITVNQEVFVGSTFTRPTSIGGGDSLRWAPANATFTSVPEPSSTALLGLGGLALLLRRKK